MASGRSGKSNIIFVISAWHLPFIKGMMTENRLFYEDCNGIKA